MRFMSALVLLSIFSTVSHASVRISDIEQFEIPAGLRIHDNGVDVVCAPRIPNQGIPIEGKLALEGNETAQFRIVALDKAGNEIQVKTMTDSPVIVKQDGSPNPAKSFKFYLTLNDLCGTIGGEAVTVGVLSQYIRSLKLSAITAQ
jgi:hypothetical protein